MDQRREGPRAEAFAAVLSAAQTGAGWACTEIWTDYAGPVAAFLRARGSREPDDLTSEVFLSVFDRLGSFVGGEPEFRSFVFSIAFRRLVDELRQRSRRPEADEWRAEIDPRRSPSAAEEAATRLGDARVLHLLAGLPDDQRTVLTLRIVADLTVEQIAAIVDKSPGAVKALQRRGLERLRKKVSPTRTLSDPPDDSQE